MSDIAKRFEEKFGEPITDDDVREFVALAKKEGLLERSKRQSCQRCHRGVATAERSGTVSAVHQASQEAESAVLSGQII